jgi:hypothetical protein
MTAASRAQGIDWSGMADPYDTLETMDTPISHALACEAKPLMPRMRLDWPAPWPGVRMRVWLIEGSAGGEFNDQTDNLKC